MSLGNPDVPGPWTSCSFRDRRTDWTCKEAQKCLRERNDQTCINGGTLRNNLIELVGSNFTQIDLNNSQE